MPRPINFTAIEILPALLDKSKTQTIRPLFKIEWLKRNPLKPQDKEGVMHKKEPRFKVGDKAKLYWKMRSKDWWHCACGKFSIQSSKIAKEAHTLPPLAATTHSIACSNKIFPKLLGEVEIIEVFEIKMSHLPENGWRMSMPNLKIGHDIDTQENNIKFIQDIFQKDGFKELMQFFTWFDKKYNLSTPKRFAVYRWKWLS